MGVNEPTKNLTLVLGGNGKTGRKVAERLRQADHPVRIGSRAGAPPFDWGHQDTWGPALRGVKAAYVSFQPDLAVPGAPETVQAFFDHAVDAGVERIVLLSGRGEVEAEHCENVLKAAGADWTILRSSWFCQNFSESFLVDAALAGEVALPGTPAPEPFIDTDDIADVAFAALTGAGHSDQLYELTGPRSLTFAEAVAEIGSATERHISFIQVSPEDYAAELTRQGVPKGDIELVVYLFTTVLDGRNTPLADGVQRAIGRAPRDFSDYVRQTAASGVWSVQP